MLKTPDQHMKFWLVVTWISGLIMGGLAMFSVYSLFVDTSWLSSKDQQLPEVLRGESVLVMVTDLTGNEGFPDIHEVHIRTINSIACWKIFMTLNIFSEDPGDEWYPREITPYMDFIPLEPKVSSNGNSLKIYCEKSD